MSTFIRLRRGGEYLKYENPPLFFAGNAFLPQRATILLHESSSLKPVVFKGEYVREGEVIAKGIHFGQLHASVSGRVVDFPTVNFPNGKKVEAISIETEGRLSLLGTIPQRHEWHTEEISDLVRIIDDAGVASLSEVSFAQYLTESIEAKKKILSLLFFNTDPTDPLDIFLAQTFPKEITEGVAIIQRILDAQSVICVHQFAKKAAILEHLRAEISDISFMQQQRHRYPSQKIRDRQALSASCELDCRTALAVYEAVVLRRPITAVYVAVTGKSIKKPQVLKVRIGTAIEDIIEECGGFTVRPEHVVMNGLLKGRLVDDLSIPVGKQTRSLYAAGKESLAYQYPNACHDCGSCMRVCPVFIDPEQVVWDIEHKVNTDAVFQSLRLCNGCGLCSAACPARRPLAHILLQEKLKYLQGDSE